MAGCFFVRQTRYCWWADKAHMLLLIACKNSVGIAGCCCYQSSCFISVMVLFEAYIVLFVRMPFLTFEFRVVPQLFSVSDVRVCKRIGPLSSAGRVIRDSMCCSLVSTNAVSQHQLKRTLVVFMIKIETFWSALAKFRHRYLHIIFPKFHLLLHTKYFGFCFFFLQNRTFFKPHKTYFE